MDSRILGLRISGVIFALMSLGQLSRALLRIEVVIAGYVVPFWPSLVAFFVLACLSFWLWRVSLEP